MSRKNQQYTTIAYDIDTTLLQAFYFAHSNITTTNWFQSCSILLGGEAMKIKKGSGAYRSSLTSERGEASGEKG